MDLKNEFLIYILVFGTFGILSTEMGMVGILPQISQYFHINIADAGLFVSLFAFFIALSGVFTPLYFSKFERKKVFSMVLAVFTICSFLCSVTTDFKLALIFRNIPALVQPIYVGFALTVAGELVSEDKKHFAISKILMGLSAGIISVPLTSFIANIFGYSQTMCFFSILTGIALILTLIFFPTIPGKKESYSNQTKVVKSEIFIISVLAVIIVAAGSYTSYSYISEYLNVMSGIFNMKLTFMLLLFGIMSILGNEVAARLLVWDGNKTMMLFPFLSSILFLVIFVIYDYFVLLVICVALWGILQGINNNILQYWMLSSAPQSPEFANGLYLSMGNLGVAIGTEIAAMIVITSGVHYIMLGAIMVLFVGLILITHRVRKYPQYNKI